MAGTWATWVGTCDEKTLEEVRKLEEIDNDIKESTPLDEDGTSIGIANGAAPSAGTIQAIDRGTVHRICSGQVVLTLGTAVKELVENSLDAGASIVDVKLKEYGSEVIEVIDNGHGIADRNFAGITLKHHTSKLQDFSDLVNVETFGFRGEALSSLCALSGLSVVTKHENASVGTKLEFDHHGKIVSQVPQARQLGTTVMIQNLFSTLPVRHKEFQRNLKKEFAKMVQVLNSYCIISTGARITCTNQTGKGSRSVVVSTKGNSSIRENMSNIYGPKQVQNLLEFKQKSPKEDVCSEFGLKSDINISLFRIGGYISRCDHGQGRSSTDRQFFYINKRPCDSTKLSKVVNEVYHMYNRHQYPFVVLHIAMDKEAVDVNVTPDKRQIFMQEEKCLLAVIKSSLIQMFEPTTSVIQLNLLNMGQRTGSIDSVSDSESPTISFSSGQIDRSVTDTPKESIANTLGKLKRSFASAFAKEDPPSMNDNVKKHVEGSPNKSKQRRLDCFVSKTTSSETSLAGLKNPEMIRDNQIQIESSSSSAVDKQGESDAEKCTDQESGICSSQDTVTVDSQSSIGEVIFSPVCSSSSLEEQTKNDSHSQENVRQSDLEHEDRTCQNQDGDSGRVSKTISPETTPESSYKVTHVEFDSKEDVERKDCTAQFCLASLRRRLMARQKSEEKESNFCRSFRATISPSDNKSAEDELQKEITKDMFGKMKILGQFNLGFIITKHGDDLFIVDQHATDEKYNFEMLQKHTVIQSQRLIQPQVLELTSSNETVLIDNLEVFKKNGFDFLIDENAPPTQRIKLVSTPVSKNWTFGKDDIEELIFMLTESSGIMCRPSRVREMFASRACRKSVMIGTALNKAEMKKLVCHMGEINQPWNCPHGRPTMRHLINLNMVPS